MSEARDVEDQVHQAVAQHLKAPDEPCWGVSETPRTDAALNRFSGERAGTPEEFDAMLSHAYELERELQTAQRHYLAAKAALKQIFEETDAYADGAPDASEHDKLCNQIASIARPFRARKETP